MGHSSSSLFAVEKKGVRIFHKAYKEEESNSNKKAAIELYERALKLGIDKNLERVALWRLLYLYSDDNNYIKMLEVANNKNINKNIYNYTKKVLVKKWYVPESQFSLLAKGAKGLQKEYQMKNLKKEGQLKQQYPKIPAETGGKDEDYFFLLFRSKPNNQKKDTGIARKRGAKNERRLLHNVLKLYSHYEQERAAIYLLNRLDEYHLEKANLLVKIGENKLAKKLLLNLANTSEEKSSTLKKEEKGNILYLLGQIYSKEKKYLLAVGSFRMAARYSSQSSRQQERMLSLSAYTLYKAEKREQALNMLESIHVTENTYGFFLRLLLRVELKEDKDALRELKKRKKYFSKREAKGLVLLIKKKLEQLEAPSH